MAQVKSDTELLLAVSSTYGRDACQSENIFPGEIIPENICLAL